jgi:ubiquinone/menaquinone biosynthesis C-methylase UbiE
MYQTHLNQLRRAEIEMVRHWFTPGMNVLEIGGGSGFQAGIISSWGCKVHSIDLPNSCVADSRYFPVEEYDGKNIPFPSGSFDIVFSSNVLEHISPISSFLVETQRVLKPDGLSVHILPSPAWRFWTSTAHYLYLLKYVLLGRRDDDDRNRASARKILREHSARWIIESVLFAGPHGEYPNALSELYFFSKYRWRRLFQKSGFELEAIQKSGLFYTG